MAGERRAMLIATDAYTDPGLSELRAPTGDVRALAEVLADKLIGGFDVEQLINRTTDEVKQEVEGFFDEARLEDVLLLYISGHGVLSPTRRLYFATTSTKLRRLRATAIDDRFVYDVIDHSRARSIVLMLDCCHSGAFAKGLTPKSALGVDVEQRFDFPGRGRITLTASTEMEYAFEDAEADASITELGASVAGSLFTRYLIEGLKTGKADVNEDGRVSVDELYDYLFDRVRERSPHQTPGKSGAGHGDIVIAKSLRHTALPPEVREAIDQALRHPWAGIRETAVGELVRMRGVADPMLAVAIDEALRQAIDDDSRRVSAAARAALPPGADAEAQPSPVPPPTHLVLDDDAGTGPADKRFRDPTFVKRHLASRSATVRGLAKYLAQRPGQWIASEPIADALNLERGSSSLTGALGAAGRYFKNRAMGKPWHWTYQTPDGNVQLMMDPETAEVVNSVLSEATPSSEPAPIDPLADDEAWAGRADERFRDAAFVKDHLASRSETVRGVAKYLAQRPGRWIPSGPIADALNLEHGSNSLAGALGAAGRYLKNRRIGMPWHWTYQTPDGNVQLMIDPETAKVVNSVLEQTARSKASFFRRSQR
jgi:hypothetical protein